MDDETSVHTVMAVARRALCLAALCFRARIEAAVAGNMGLFRDTSREPTWRLHATAARINSWLASEQLRDGTSAVERGLLNARPGNVNPQEVINATWRVEALAVLLWALRLTERMPSYDTQVDLDAALERIGFLKDTDALVADARLRSLVELKDAREIAELWHWRARTYQIEHEPDHHLRLPGKTDEEIVHAVATKAQDDGRFVAIAGDFPVFGKAYCEATEREWRLLLSIARERHHGFNWLCDMCEDWDEVTTDT